MSHETLKLETDARGVASLTLARADKHNAMNATMIRELANVAKRLAGDPAVRAVVLSGEGASFSAGGDLGWMQEQWAKDRAGRIAEAGMLAGMLKALDDLPQPLIARVHGPAYGGGLGLMAVSDVVIASTQAKFALTETRLGLIPATIGPFVVRRIGEGHARSVFLNAKPFDAATAQRLGLATIVCAPGEIDQAVEAEVAAVLKCAPGAVRDAKALAKHLARNPASNLGPYSIERLADRWESAEARDGIEAFFARKSPPWTS
ncbi:MAG: crotonase/enoyl-CoA hydratase family protein [Hyphomicrobiaceae bacterium]